MAQRLTVLVAVAVILVFSLVVLEIPEQPPRTVVGGLPVSPGFVTLPNPGTYAPMCSLTSFSTRWAVFLSTTNGANRTFHLTGAWTSTRGTGIWAIPFGDTDDPQVLANLVEPGSCPPALLRQFPGPPALPYSGKVDLNLTTYAGSTRLAVLLYSYDSADVVMITQSIALSPV